MFKYLPLSLIIWLGFLLRLRFMQGHIFHPDEFVTLLALERIQEFGWPIFPSGEFYDHGLPFSYLAALFTSTTGANELLGRWVALWFSLLSLPLMYVLARRLFHSAQAGYLAAFVFAIYPASVYWGARVRMYSLTQFCYLLAILFLWLGFSQKRLAYRLVAYVALAVGIVAHLGLIVALPALLGASLVLAWQTGYFQITKCGVVLKEALFVAILFGLVLMWGQSSWQVRYAVNTEGETNANAVFFWERVNSVIQFEAFASAWESLSHYFLYNEHQGLNLILGLGGVLVLGQFIFKRTIPSAKAVGFIGLTALLLVAEVFLLKGEFRNGRYYFIWLLPLFCLLSAYTFASLLDWLNKWSAKLNPVPQFNWPGWVLITLVYGLLMATIWPQTNLEMTEPFKTYPYHLAWGYVAEQIGPEDVTLSAWPAPGVVYGPGVDYYANQHKPFVIFADDQTLIDKYAGAQFIPDEAAFNALLAQPGRLWFVIEDGRLFNFFEAGFVGQILHQMTLAQSFDNIYVLVERENARPLPALEQPMPPVSLAGVLDLVGYTTVPPTLIPGQTLELTLFWRLQNPPANYKVFVHLRDENGSNVAQADFIPLQDELYSLQAWANEIEAEDMVRTRTTLRLPPELEPREYSLYVGMYNALNFERLPVTNDTSGENAILLPQKFRVN